MACQGQDMPRMLEEITLSKMRLAVGAVNTL